MNVYSYINSKDIRKHCIDINHQFDPIATAYLIWQSKGHTIAEKHKAYMEIADKYPDIYFYMREWDYKGIYLKDFLTKYIEIENKLLSAFDNSQNVFYTYQKVGEEMTSKMLRERLYKNKELCLSAIKEYEQPNYWDKCEVICRHIIGSIKDKPFSISLQINGNFENNYITEAGYLSKEESKTSHTFDDMKIEVPLPFKENDYVIQKYRYLAIAFEHRTHEFEFSERGMYLNGWICKYDEYDRELYVSNYLNLEYASIQDEPKYDSSDEDCPF